MKIIYTIIFGLLSITSFCQNGFQKNKTISLTTGRISFGTGDFFGYGVNIGYARRLNEKNKVLKHLFAGAELNFEHGNKQPKVINPTPWEFIKNTYYSTTNITLTSKICYYPFTKTIARGINISLGGSVGYTNQNFESQAAYVVNPVTQTSVRRSYLDYINEVIIGYRITTGYEVYITKKLLIGARLDFINNTLGDINTLLAGKIGYSF